MPNPSLERLLPIAVPDRWGSGVSVRSLREQPLQHIPSDDVAAAVSEIARGAPVNGKVAIARPRRQSMGPIVER